jgi:crossover junction endodeoxyribonuclease RuvC
MRILGIDPGSHVMGWGVLDGAPGAPRHVAHGSLRAPRGADVPARLAAVWRGLAAVIEAHAPELAVVERSFVAASPRTALVLGEARGVALASAALAGMPVAEYTARQIKLAVTGSGAAGKGEVQGWVRRLLGLAETPPEDAADALAAALCHALGAGAAPRGRSRRRGRGRGRASIWVMRAG